MERSLAIGIDIGGTNTILGIVDKQGMISKQASICTADYQTSESFVEKVIKELHALLATVDKENIAGIGIGAPLGNIYTGEITNAPNFKWHGTVPIVKLVSESVGLRVVLTNDANAAAIGELYYGAAKNMTDFIVVTLGTGLGSGFVVNGQLVYGHDGYAGELGHVTAVRNGRKCGCGKRGCLEQYCSATGLVATTKKWLNELLTDSLLVKDKASITSELVYRAALAGDKLALDVFDYTAQLLGQSLANAVAITSPQAIILFGGLSKAEDVLLRPLRTHLEQNLLHVYRNKIELLTSALPDTDAAILGASALAW